MKNNISFHHLVIINYLSDTRINQMRSVQCLNDFRSGGMKTLYNAYNTRKATDKI